MDDDDGDDDSEEEEEEDGADQGPTATRVRYWIFLQRLFFRESRRCLLYPTSLLRSFSLSLSLSLSLSMMMMMMMMMMVEGMTNMTNVFTSRCECACFASEYNASEVL